MSLIDPKLQGRLRRRRRIGKAMSVVCGLTAFVGVAMLAILLFDIIHDGAGSLSWEFLNNFPSRFASKAGLKAALYGTLWVISITALVAIPVGVGAGIYLEEFAAKNAFGRFVNLNIANLAGVPSIVYGILGLIILVRWCNLGRSVISGALILALLILPVIIIAAQEAIRAVPNSLRHAAYALGATRWQTVRHHVLPVASPWIFTGVILAISRAIGETAPLIMVGALSYVAFVPQSLADGFTALPIQIYIWANFPQKEFHKLAAAGIIVLLVVLLTMNAIAIYMRHRHQKQLKW